MKIKQLRAALAKAGYDVSDRMIKYYIEIGILPQPYHTAANQADYTRLHLIRLMKTAALKKCGVPFARIREIFASDDAAASLYARERGLTLEQVWNLDFYADREAAAYYADYAPDTAAMSAQQLMEKCGCEGIVFDLARDTGAITDKTEYGKSDLVALLCIKYFFNDKNAAFSTVEKISELSKINNIAAQLGYIYEKSESDRKLYETLVENLTESKMKRDIGHD